ncbi:FUSC family protein [Pseudomonas oryzihabitans]|uniref:FUSC family protein n=1 Tax=Pseudomonas oryzihabitans TaxID=47885 RepID=UPI0011AABC90|nr:FUSC family protein [Pseudomonas psychrotolerans]
MAGSPSPSVTDGAIGAPREPRWALALACLPALATILLGALLTGAWLPAVVALGGAFTVGFGAYKSFAAEPLAPMLVAALGMAGSAVVGSLLGHQLPALVLAGALWAACCAWLFAVGNGPWWITQQWTVALLVAGGFPGDLHQALARGGLVLAGGLLQLLLFALLQKALYRSQWQLRSGSLRAHLREVVTLFEDRFRLGRYGFYAAAVVALCQTLTGLLDYGHGYWAPMTALLVLKPRLGDTWRRGLGRLGGTLAGCLLASAVVWVDDTPAVLAGACLLCAAGAYLLQDGRYSLQTLFITGTTVLMVALAGAPERAIALERLGSTLLGGGVALLFLALEAALERRLAPVQRWRRRRQAKAASPTRAPR